jgi:predicted lipoprotein with Yx(FWY)xxD motif
MFFVRPKRTVPLFGTGAAIVAFGVMLVTGSGAFGASSGPTLRTSVNPSLGETIVVDSAGFTLYHFENEKNGQVSCTGTCRKTWPPLLVTSGKAPVAGPGLSAAKVRTIKRRDGGTQVTYDGYALYLYSGDKKAGQAGGQGVGSAWYALLPSGAVTKKTPKTAASPATTTSATVTTPARVGTTPAPATTTASPAPTPAPGPVTDNADGCAAGTVIPQGAAAGDGDTDNTGGETDGDGCL